MQPGSPPTRATRCRRSKRSRLRSSGGIGGRPGCGPPIGRSRTPPPMRLVRVRARGFADDKEDDMPLLRGRRDDGGTKYRMREKLFSIGDDYWIENEQDERAVKVGGKAMRGRAQLG